MRIDIKSIALLAAGAALTGCVHTDPTAVEKDFGNSVRQMVQAQTLDPLAGVQPDSAAIETSDGERLNKVIEAYRSDVSKPEDVQQDIVINLGN